tara:strand:+ start:7519 stop:8007 length:489 start_codon:yes stop_codon:yes gene_type:complete
MDSPIFNEDDLIEKLNDTNSLRKRIKRKKIKNNKEVTLVKLEGIKISKKCKVKVLESKNKSYEKISYLKSKLNTNVVQIFKILNINESLERKKVDRLEQYVLCCENNGIDINRVLEIIYFEFLINENGETYRPISAILYCNDENLFINMIKHSIQELKSKDC